MSPYATGTDVPVDRSKAELEKLLHKYSASRFICFRCGRPLCRDCRITHFCRPGGRGQLRLP